MADNQTPQSPAAGYDLTEQALPWQDLLASVFRHRRLVLTLLLVGVVGATVRAWMLPPTYKATALLMVRDNRARMTVSPDERMGAVLDRADDQQINSLITLALSPEVVKDVLKDSRMDDPPEEVVAPSLWDRIVSFPSDLYRKIHNVPEPNPLDSKANAIANNIEAWSARKSSLIQVSYYSGDPHWASMLTNLLVGKVIATYTALYDTTGAQRFYGEQRELLSKRVDDAQAALNAFRERVGPELLTLNRDQLRERIAQLEQDRAGAKTEIAELDARLAADPDSIYSDATSADAGSGIVVNPAVSAIKARLIELQIQRSELIARYAPGSVMITDINRQIAEAQRLLAQERANTIDLYRKDATARLNSAHVRIDAVKQQLAEYRDQLAQVEGIAPEWERLQSELDTQRQSYMTYLRKEEEARVSNALDESQILNVAVAQKATVPRDPEPSPMLKFIAMGGGIGMFLGIGLALLRDWLDPSVKTTSQAERLTGIPVLGEVSF